MQSQQILLQLTQEQCDFIDREFPGYPVSFTEWYIRSFAEDGTYIPRRLAQQAISSPLLAVPPATDALLQRSASYYKTDLMPVQQPNKIRLVPTIPAGSATSAIPSPATPGIDAIKTVPFPFPSRRQDIESLATVQMAGVQLPPLADAAVAATTNDQKLILTAQSNEETQRVDSVQRANKDEKQQQSPLPSISLRVLGVVAIVIVCEIAIALCAIFALSAVWITTPMALPLQIRSLLTIFLFIAWGTAAALVWKYLLA